MSVEFNKTALKNKEHLQKEVKTNAGKHMWEAYRD